MRTPPGSRKIGFMRRSLAASPVFRYLPLLLLSVCICSCSTDSTDKPASKRINPLAGCVMCHVDVEDEFVQSKHYRGLDGGCIDCHGPSGGHLADENNDIKPEEVFARKDVNRLCGVCHKCSRKIQPHKTRIAPDKQKVCTDCHKSHMFGRKEKGSPKKTG